MQDNGLRIAGFTRDSWEDFATLNVVKSDGKSEVSGDELAVVQTAVSAAAIEVTGSSKSSVVKVLSRNVIEKQAVNTNRSDVETVARSGKRVVLSEGSPILGLVRPR
jgi:hypothetical protein